MRATDKLINEITLECLMNKCTYDKYRQTLGPGKKSAHKKDKKFYRRRIYDLTKQMLNPEQAQQEGAPVNIADLNMDILNTFEAYVKSCIDHFKVVDKTDILQEDYKNLLDLDVDNSNQINVDSIHSVEQADQCLMRSIKIREPNTLEKFVKRKECKVEEPKPLPQQKDVNLKDPALKNKGIRKKKNITNTYTTPTTITNETPTPIPNPNPNPTQTPNPKPKPNKNTNDKKTENTKKPATSKTWVLEI